MFTGLVENTGIIKGRRERDGLVEFRIRPDELPYDNALGDSVALNGCCLTVTKWDGPDMFFDVSRETLLKTNLALLKEGAAVNLERAMKLGDRLGGHLVSGHVDGLAEVVKVEQRPDGWVMGFRLPPAFQPYVIAKGSICLNGVSLTINDVLDRDDGCDILVTLIPTTLAKTNLRHLKVGDKINFEIDQLAKYIERFSLFRR